jgi:hypothetical protein
LRAFSQVVTHNSRKELKTHFLISRICTTGGPQLLLLGLNAQQFHRVVPFAHQRVLRNLRAARDMIFFNMPQ